MEKKSISLKQLLSSVPGIISLPGDDAWINRIQQDSRQVQPGDLFVAFSGGAVDGHEFISDAIQRGASAIMGTLPKHNLGVPYVHVENSRLALAFVAAAYYNFPAKKLFMIGVTGTDGKTTTANMIFDILKSAGFQAGMISTVNAVFGNQVMDTGFHVTTPDSLDVQFYLSQMVAAGVTHVVLEATSHGLAQHRVDACEFDLAVVTNITHEHLDYHGSYEAYRAAKAKLFSFLVKTQPKEFSTPGCAILNFDDISYPFLAETVQTTQLSYGTKLGADIQAKQIKQTATGLFFSLFGKDIYGSLLDAEISTPLFGIYNVSNCLAAIAACSGAMGIDILTARDALRNISKVPGRMEFFDLGQDFYAAVDFAHTPNALRNALEAARPLAEKRVIAVFGSAGLRDKEKRRMMAEISVEFADITVLTAEDPRTESLAGILEEMAVGAINRGGVEGKSFYRIHDRGAAIRFATGIARHGDIVLVCGKGHEQSMCFGEIEYLWDDRTALKSALSELMKVTGPEMPYLPTQSPGYSS